MGVGVALLAAAAVCYARDGHRAHGGPRVGGDHEVLIYLNETLVMDILRYRHDVQALKRQVEQYTRESAEGRGEVKVRWFSLGAGRVRDRERTETYEAEESPITAIRRVVQRLERADAIVYADLRTGELHAHRRLGDVAQGGARLSDSGLFLSIDGRFEEYDEGDESDRDYVRLRAPYPSGDAYVRVKITSKGLRGEKDVLPEGRAPFPARVLGKVESWDEQNRLLKMWALAIFY